MDEIRLSPGGVIGDYSLLGRGDGTLSDDESLTERGISDASGTRAMAVFVEKECGVHLESDEVLSKDMTSIGRLVEFVAARLGRNGDALRWDVA